MATDADQALVRWPRCVKPPIVARQKAIEHFLDRADMGLAVRSGESATP